MNRTIFHVDINSAFLSWEAAKRVAEGQEDLRLVPSAVGGDRNKRTGVILAKSIPAKKYGVKTGEAVATALKKCPDLILVKPDFRLYEKSSRAFMELCRRYTPVVEKYSIDECFLDMTGTENLYPNMHATAKEIKNTIREELGFTANIGIGPNKLLAKMASDFEKPDKVHTLAEEEIPEKLWPLPVGSLFTVGKATAEKLTDAGIESIGDLAHANLKTIQQMLGAKPGWQLWHYANGQDPSPVLSEPEESKGYSISTTLEKDVTTISQANTILLSLSDSVSARMRTDNAKTCCIGVAMRTNDFKNKSHQKKLIQATDSTEEIYKTAKALFAELWVRRQPLRLIGISLTDILRDEGEQISLFRDEKKEKSRKIDQAVDNIRSRFGTATISRGSILNSPNQVGKKYQAQMETQQHEKQVGSIKNNPYAPDQE